MTDDLDPVTDPVADLPIDPAADRARVEALLGRRPQGAYEVVVRRLDGWPVVLRNAPLLESGRPMPTRYWLIDRELSKDIGRLEAERGVNRAEADIDPEVLAAAHDAYAGERNAEIERLAAEHGQHPGPLPSGGVGGTRVGVKCLHAHYAHFLAGGDDPVGQWVDDRLGERGRAFDPARPARPLPGTDEELQP